MFTTDCYILTFRLQLMGKICGICIVRPTCPVSFHLTYCYYLMHVTLPPGKSIVETFYMYIMSNLTHILLTVSFIKRGV